MTMSLDWLSSCAWVMDLDGTLYRGNRALPGAAALLRRLREREQPTLFLTNNSSRTPEDVADHLKKLGMEATADDVCTSSQVAAHFVMKGRNQAPRVCVIGESGLRKELLSVGCVFADRDVDFVVLGIDRQFSYEKIRYAAQCIRDGATLVVTNPDLSLPSENGLQPGTGALAAAIAATAGCSPVVMGKPEAMAVEFAMARLRTKADQTLLLGDNLLTDIEAASRVNMRSILVLTGYSTKQDANHSVTRPTLIVDDLPSLLAQWVEFEKSI